MKFEDLNGETPVELLLVRALGRLMSLPGYQDKTPDEIIEILEAIE